MKVWKDRDLGTPEHDELMIRLLKWDVWLQLIDRFKLRKDEEPLEKPLLIRAEVPVVPDTYARRQFILGYIDITLEEQGRLYGGIACEIKATEPSLGTAIRQVNKYRRYTGYDAWVVVSPYKEWKEPLESQGIVWIPSQFVLLL